MPGWLVGPSGKEFPLYGLLDSGADGSCFPEQWVEFLGVDLADCAKLDVQTGAGIGRHYEARQPLTLTVAGIKIPVRSAFGPVGVAILGRGDFFEHFYVEIDERAKVTYLRPHAAAL